MQNLLANDITEFKITEIKQSTDGEYFSRIILMKGANDTYTSITITSETRETLLLTS